jgi:molybdopterin synthase sulfur carrier subunit
MITVQVRLYATLRHYRPEVKLGESLPMELPEGATVGRLIARLGIPAEVVKTIFVNHCQQGPEHVLQNGDEVAIFPPVAGG